jgi:hypothetical protein
MKFGNVAVALFAICAAACSGDGGFGAGSGGGSGSSSSSSSSGSSGSSSGGIQDITLEPTFSSIQTGLFSTVCVECHSGSTPPQGLNFEAAQSYGLLVDVPSNEVPGVDRVEPGDPDNSYIIHKLEGTAAVGLRMPANGPPYLTDEQIAVIRQWISDGAVDDRTVMAGPAGLPGSSFRVVAVNPQPDATLEQAPAYISLAMNKAVDVSLVHEEAIKVVGSGGDGTFADGNEYVVGPVEIEVSVNNPGLIIVNLGDAALTADRYRIVVSDYEGIAVATTAAVPLDGDGDGAPGGEFISHFIVL